MTDRAGQYPRGAALTLAELREDPHPGLARLREAEPVSWVPPLNGWLVTRWDLAAAVMRDSVTFTVDDPRFSTAWIVGPSMLSLDGQGHSQPAPGEFRWTTPSGRRYTTRPAPIRDETREAGSAHEAGPTGGAGGTAL